MCDDDDDRVWTCDYCSEDISEDVDFGTDQYSDVGRVCQPCAEDIGHNTFLCVECSRRCGHEADAGGPDEHMCVECADAYHSHTCDNCSVTYYFWDGYDEAYCSESCYDEAHEEDTDSDGVHDYSYEPTNLLFHDVERSNFASHPKKLYLGVEIEVEYPEGYCIGDGVARVCDCDDERNWYAKSDSSIEYGCEYVSHPRTYSSWAKGSALKTLGREREHEGLSYETDTCGMHVHASRSVCTHLTAYKIARWVSENWILARALSRRRWRSLQAYSDLCNFELGSRAARRARYRECVPSHGKMVAIHMAHRETVEFRLFRGTLQPEAALRNIALVTVLIHWARDTSIRDIGLESLLHWIRSHEGDRIVGRSMANKLLAWLASAEARYAEIHFNRSIEDTCV